MLKNEKFLVHCFVNVLLSMLTLYLFSMLLGYSKMLGIVGGGVCILSFTWSLIVIVRFYTSMTSRDIDYFAVVGPYLLTTTLAVVGVYNTYGVYSQHKGYNSVQNATTSMYRLPLNAFGHNPLNKSMVCKGKVQVGPTDHIGWVTYIVSHEKASYLALKPVLYKLPDGVGVKVTYSLSAAVALEDACTYLYANGRSAVVVDGVSKVKSLKDILADSTTTYGFAVNQALIGFKTYGEFDQSGMEKLNRLVTNYITPILKSQGVSLLSVNVMIEKE